MRWIVHSAAANAGGAVYGTLLVGIMFAAEEARHAGYPATIEAATVVLVVYWLTSFYAHTLGVRLQRREPLDWRLICRGCLYELPILEGAVVPLLVLIVAWTAGLPIGDGVAVAVWAAVATVVVLEVLAGWRSRRRPLDFVMQAVAGVAMGLALIAVKLLL
jgi:hypothetical protein